MSYKKLQKKRSGLQKYTWYGLLPVVAAGWFYPLLGFLLLGCMLGALAVAVFRGRAWCDWMCPRGAFYDLFIKKWSRAKGIPGFLRSPVTRGAVMLTLFGVVGYQTVRNWGDWPALGLAFVTMLTVTTLIGIVLGLVFKERAWCMICPMGTLGNLLSTGKEPLTVNAESCNSCAACLKVCPMELYPGKHAGKPLVAENDCVKCGGCVAVCPKNSVVFGEKKAA